MSETAPEKIQERVPMRSAIRCGALLDSHAEGRRLGEQLIQQVQARPGGFELRAAVAGIATGSNKLATARSNGFFRAVQEKLERVLP